MNPNQFVMSGQRNNAESGYGGSPGSQNAGEVQRILRRNNRIFWFFIGGALVISTLILLAVLGPRR